MFPYRISWLRAIGLILTRLIFSILVSDTINALPDKTIRSALNLIGWICFSMLMGVWSHLIFVFQKKAKLWEPKQNSVREAVNALKISFCSDLAALGILLISFIIGYNFFSSLRYSNTPEDAELFTGIAGLIMIFSWIIITPSLYQQELNKELRRTAKQSTKKKTRTVKQKPKSFH